MPIDSGVDLRIRYFKANPLKPFSSTLNRFKFVQTSAAMRKSVRYAVNHERSSSTCGPGSEQALISAINLSAIIIGIIAIHYRLGKPQFILQSASVAGWSLVLVIDVTNELATALPEQVFGHLRGIMQRVIDYFMACRLLVLADFGCIEIGVVIGFWAI